MKLMTGVFTADTALKLLAEKVLKDRTIELADGTVKLRRVENRGMAMNLLQDNPKAVMAISGSMLMAFFAGLASLDASRDKLPKGLAAMPGKKDLLKAAGLHLRGVTDHPVQKQVSLAAGKKWEGVERIGLSLAAAGGLNNLVDRMVKGYVTDYLHVDASIKGTDLRDIVWDASTWPDNGRMQKSGVDYYCNLSDICIFLGTFLAFLGKSNRK
ncbi:MAG: signal peptidase II [Eubacterium sp.]|nr:signal peptidase II [Eubacterium sp.]